jgi:hypothetical protein
MVLHRQRPLRRRPGWVIPSPTGWNVKARVQNGMYAGAVDGNDGQNLPRQPRPQADRQGLGQPDRLRRRRESTHRQRLPAVPILAGRQIDRSSTPDSSSITSTSILRPARFRRAVVRRWLGHLRLHHQGRSPSAPSTSMTRWRRSEGHPASPAARAARSCPPTPTATSPA